MAGDSYCSWLRSLMLCPLLYMWHMSSVIPIVCWFWVMLLWLHPSSVQVLGYMALFVKSFQAWVNQTSKPWRFLIWSRLSKSTAARWTFLPLTTGPFTSPLLFSAWQPFCKVSTKELCQVGMFVSSTYTGLQRRNVRIIISVTLHYGKHYSNKYMIIMFVCAIMDTKSINIHTNIKTFWHTPKQMSIQTQTSIHTHTHTLFSTLCVPLSHSLSLCSPSHSFYLSLSLSVFLSLTLSLTHSLSHSLSLSCSSLPQVCFPISHTNGHRKFLTECRAIMPKRRQMLFTITILLTHFPFFFLCV